MNQGLLRCRVILYQLNYQGSHPHPHATKQTNKQKTHTHKNQKTKNIQTNKQTLPYRKLKVIKWKFEIIQSSLHDLVKYKGWFCFIYFFNDSSSLHPILFQAIHLLQHYTSSSLIHPSFLHSYWLLLFLCSFSVVSKSVTPWTAACQASWFFIISQSLLKLMSIDSVMPSNHLILCCSFPLLPSVFTSIRDFSNKWDLPTRWP